jgi:serine/threonine protein kinase
MVKMIDNYTLLETLGEGNYGKVYRAKNIKNNQDYAIKIIPT